MSENKPVLVWVDNHDSTELQKSIEYFQKKDILVKRCKSTSELQDYVNSHPSLKHHQTFRIITNRVRPCGDRKETADGLIEWLRKNDWSTPVLVYCGKPELCRNLELRFNNVLVSKSKTTSRTFGSMEPVTFQRTLPSYPHSSIRGSHSTSEPKLDQHLSRNSETKTSSQPKKKTNKTPSELPNSTQKINPQEDQNETRNRKDVEPIQYYNIEYENVSDSDSLSLPSDDSDQEIENRNSNHKQKSIDQHLSNLNHVSDEDFDDNFDLNTINEIDEIIGKLDRSTLHKAKDSDSDELDLSD